MSAHGRRRIDDRPTVAMGVICVDIAAAGLGESALHGGIFFFRLLVSNGFENYERILVVSLSHYGYAFLIGAESYFDAGTCQTHRSTGCMRSEVFRARNKGCAAFYAGMWKKDVDSCKTYDVTTRDET